MKYLIPFILCFLCLNGLQAQTLPNSVMPEIGDIYSINIGDTTSISEGPAGTNVVWDFSALEPDGAFGPMESSFVDPASTPFADQFPGTNIALVFEFGMGTNVYSYYKKDGNKLDYLGGESLGTFTFMTADPQLTLQTGISLGQPVEDSFMGFIETVVGSTYSSGHQIIEVDASGTLHMPMESYSNAIRVKTVLDRADSTNTAGAIVISRTQSTSYNWFISGQIQPIVTIAYTEGEVESIIPGIPPTVSPTPRTKSVSYNPNIETTTTSTQEEVSAIEDVRVYPNPTDGPMTLEIVRLSQGPVDIHISDVQGRTIMRRSEQLNTGTHQLPLDLSAAPAGHYILTLTDKTTSISYRLLKK